MPTHSFQSSYWAISVATWTLARGGRDLKQNWEGCGINSVDGVSRERSLTAARHVPSVPGFRPRNPGTAAGGCVSARATDRRPFLYQRVSGGVHRAAPRRTGDVKASQDQRAKGRYLWGLTLRTIR